jgi:sucrose phosphorylase
VYYVGLLAGHNDEMLLERTGVGRDINRHYYPTAEVHQALKRPVVIELLDLMRLRNTHPAFQGQFSLLPSEDTQLHLRWDAPGNFVELRVCLETLTHTLTCSA